MLWVKTFHILFVMSWMAGIFYLPRIFVHFVEGQTDKSHHKNCRKAANLSVKVVNIPGVRKSQGVSCLKLHHFRISNMRKPPW